jgi:urate oxidase
VAEATGRKTVRGETVLGQNSYGIYDLERFGMENDNEIFHATGEPYGLIEGTVERAG